MPGWGWGEEPAQNDVITKKPAHKMYPVSKHTCPLQSFKISSSRPAQQHRICACGPVQPCDLNKCKLNLQNRIKEARTHRHTLHW